MNDFGPQRIEKLADEAKNLMDPGPFKSPLTGLIDDRTYGRFDKRKSSLYYGQYFSEGTQARIRAKARRKLVRDVRRKSPGRSLKEVALYAAVRSVQMKLQTLGTPLRREGNADAPAASGQICQGPNVANAGLRSWTALTEGLLTPSAMGVDRFDGSPEETARIIRHAGIQFGAARVGFTGLDRRHVYSHDCDGKEIAFEDVEEPYETADKRVIPEKCRYVFVFMLHMPFDAFRCAPDPIGSLAPFFSYTRMDFLLGHMAEYIRALGYTAIPCSNDTAPNGPFAIEAGLGEQCRADKVINPELGTMFRLCKIFTDLPVELDQPQKFGIEAFCKSCSRCVESCPVDAINKDDEASFERPGEWVNPGHKTWHGKWPTCWAFAESRSGGCGICMPVCPWNKPNTFVYRAIKGLVRRTTVFNRLLVWLDKALGYGKPLQPEDWWRKKLPSYGIDSKS